MISKNISKNSQAPFGISLKELAYETSKCVGTEIYSWSISSDLKQQSDHYYLFSVSRTYLYGGSFLAQTSSDRRMGRSVCLVTDIEWHCQQSQHIIESLFPAPRGITPRRCTRRLMNAGPCSSPLRPDGRTIVTRLTFSISISS